MTKENQPKFRYITTNLIPASESRSLIWWLSYVCFAYHYKVIVCGFLGKMLGYDWLCFTVVHGVTTNHWFEQLVYAPILWYALYKIITIVFGPQQGEVLNNKMQSLKTVALFLLAMYIYGIGIHFMNTVEIYSRVELGIVSGLLYEQVYWVDEQLSHWIQFSFFFALLSWLIMFDRLDRSYASYAAVFVGILHGLERAIGVIEGDSPLIAIALGGLILTACFIRWRRHGSDFSRAWKDFFFRHGFSFGISMPVALYSYHLTFGGFVQPSTMGNSAAFIGLFILIFTSVGFVLALLLDAMLRRRNTV